MFADKGLRLVQRVINNRVFLAAVIGICVVVVFQSVRHFDFICLDDADYVSDNPNVNSGFSLVNVRWAFVEPHFANWHPLTWLSHMLDCQLFGLHPGAHHFVNVLFHAANSALLFWLFFSMTGRVWRSLMVAALFAVHPLHVESVAWIAERKDTLSAFFWILTLAAYVGYAQRQSLVRYFAVILLFLCGCLSKSMVVTLPFVLLLLDYWPLYRIKQFQPGGVGFLHLEPKSFSWLVFEKLPLLALSAVTSVITFVAQRRGAMAGLDVLPFAARVQNAIVSYSRYLWKVLVPTNLAVIYPLRLGIATDTIVGALIALTLISVAAIFWARSRPYLLIGWLWYLGTLIPVIGLVQVGEQAMADRYTYIPLVGILLAVVWGIADLAANWKVRPAYVGIACVAVLSACVITTLHQLPYWKNDVALFSHATHVTNDNATAHALLAEALIRQGENRKGVENLQEALRIRPNSAKIHHECGLLEAKLDNYDEAIAQYREAIQLRPEYAATYNDLGVALSKVGRLEEGERALTEAIERDPRNAQAYNNHGIVLSATGRSADALRDFRHALKLSPSQIGALTNLAWLEATDDDPAIRDGPDAVRLARRACELTRFKDYHAVEVLAASQAEAGNYDEATRDVEKALEMFSADTSGNENNSVLQRLNMARQLYHSHKPFRRKTGPTQNPATRQIGTATG